MAKIKCKVQAAMSKFGARKCIKVKLAFTKLYKGKLDDVFNDQIQPVGLVLAV